MGKSPGEGKGYPPVILAQRTHDRRMAGAVKLVKDSDLNQMTGNTFLKVTMLIS